MLGKLLIGYNLAIAAAIAASGLKTADSPTALIFPLLLIPLLYHLILELMRPAKRTIKIPRQSVRLEKAAPAIAGKIEAGGISDRDRRLFLKLIGSTGLSLFFMSLVSKEAQATFFGSMPGPGTVSLKDASGNKIDPAEKQPTDGYKIAQQDDSAASSPYVYFGYVNKDGAWYIQRETITGANEGDYRYYRGASNFAANWTNRASLSYDTFENIF
jgi:hypothetical protein